MKKKKAKTHPSAKAWCVQKLQMLIRHYNAGRYNQAEVICREILNRFPQQPDAINYLGLIALAASCHTDAIRFLREAISISPTPFYYYNLGLVYKAVGDYGAALTAFQQAVRKKPNYTDALINIARLQGLQRDFHSALETLLVALASDRRRIDIYNNLGAYFKNIGEIKKAIGYYEEIIRINPKHGQAYINIAFIRKDHEPEELSRLKSVYESLEIGPDKGQVGFSIGKVLEDQEEYSAAFSFFRGANKMIRNTYEYRTDQNKKLFHDIATTFNKELFAKIEFAPAPSSFTPIFIIGMPRSGTTLVEQIISAHPQVVALGELSVLSEIIVAGGFLREGFQRVIDQATTQDLSRMREEYLARTAWISHNAPIFTDKMPQNFRYVGLIKLILPEAKLVHCRRDPMDTCWSIYKHLFSRPHEYAQDLTELGQYYHLYEGLMKHWHQVLPGFVFDVDYQNLVTDSEEQIARLLSFCGLPFEEACVRYYEKRKFVSTPSSAQVRKPIYRSALQFWRHYEAHLGELQKALQDG